MLVLDGSSVEDLPSRVSFIVEICCHGCAVCRDGDILFVAGEVVEKFESFQFVEAVCNNVCGTTLVLVTCVECLVSSVSGKRVDIDKLYKVGNGIPVPFEPGNALILAIFTVVMLAL